MRTNFHPFGPAHLAAIALVPVVAAVLALVQRKGLSSGRLIRSSLVILLLLCTVSYYGSFPLHGERIFPDHMPLELCDGSLWLVIFTLLTLKPVVFDVAYYWALAGAAMAVLTPNLTQPTLFEAVQFFADHGLIVVAVLYLVWSRQARPRRWSVGRSMLAMNIMAVFVGAFDFLFKTNYMFLRAKPQAMSLMDVFGPWPWYIVVCEGAGLVLFTLLYLPFRGDREIAPTAKEESELREVEVRLRGSGVGAG